MKIIRLFIVLLCCQVALSAAAQPGQQRPQLPPEPVIPAGTVAAPTNLIGQEFPRVDKHNRAYFRIYAPNTNKLQVDIMSKKYDMTKDSDGVWT
ncbi:MAG: esterase, partial [Prevotellaceae bacterium]|nr:esterase [Prevotellaceae bacterium]